MGLLNLLWAGRRRSRGDDGATDGDGDGADAADADGGRSASCSGANAAAAAAAGEEEQAACPSTSSADSGWPWWRRRRHPSSARALCAVAAAALAGAALGAHRFGGGSGARRRRRRGGDGASQDGRIPLRDLVRFKERQWFVEELEGARDGDPMAMLRLAKMVLHGQGCRPSALAAAEWLRKARSLGVAASLEELYATDVSAWWWRCVMLMWLMMVMR